MLTNETPPSRVGKGVGGLGRIVPFRGLRGLEDEVHVHEVTYLGGFSPLPGFEGSGGKLSTTNELPFASFSPLPGFEGSGSSKVSRHPNHWVGVSVPFRGLRGLEAGGGKCITVEAHHVSVPFRGLRGLEDGEDQLDQLAADMFQSPSGV